MKKIILLIGIFSIITLYGQDNTFPTTGNVGIGTNNPQVKLDVRGKVNLQEIAFVNAEGGDDSDPYRLRKVKQGIDDNWLELQLNDNSSESFRIYGNSCEGFNCTEYSENLYHKFDTSGNVYHKGNVGIGTDNPQAKLDIFGNAASTTNLILSANYKDAFRWRLNTIDRGYSIDLDFTCSGGDDQQEQVLRLSRSNSTRPEFQLYNNAIVANDGNVGIGTSNPQTKLDVAGTSSFSENMKVDAKVEAKEIKVTTTPTADFVFGEDYRLPKLEEVEKHIKEKKHLPEIASATEMEKEGVNVGEFQIKLLQKIEELTLYSIEQNKQIKELKEEINKLKNKK